MVESHKCRVPDSAKSVGNFSFKEYNFFGSYQLHAFLAIGVFKENVLGINSSDHTFLYMMGETIQSPNIDTSTCKVWHVTVDI